MENGIRFIASYPKSGNTWARLWLFNWLEDRDEPIPINDVASMGFCPSDDTDWIVNLAMGMPMEQIAAMDPDQQLRIRSHWQAQYYYKCRSQNVIPFMKTHAPNLIHASVHPQINWAVAHSAVYIVRNPFDVCKSYAAHIGKNYNQTIARMVDETQAIRRKTGPTCPLSSWAVNVRSWQERATVLKYEDLPLAFEGLLETFGLPYDERFDKATEFTQLERLRKMEDESGFQEASQHAKFFGREHKPLRAHHIAKIEEAFGPLLDTFGYKAPEIVEEAA